MQFMHSLDDTPAVVVMCWNRGKHAV